MAITKVMRGLREKHIFIRNQFVFRRMRYDALNQAIRLVDSQPIVANEISLFVGGEFSDFYTTQIPVGVRAFVVVPNLDVLQRT